MSTQARPVRTFPKMILKTFFSIRLSAYCLLAAMLLPVSAYGQVDDTVPRLGDLVAGSASKYCAPGVKHDIENAVDVFGAPLALRLPIARLIDIPGHEVLPMEGVLSVRPGTAEIEVYKDQSPETSDSLVWVHVGKKLAYHAVLKDEIPASLVQCVVGGRNVAFLGTLNLNGNASNLYVFDDRGRLVTTIKGGARYNVPLVMVDERGAFAVFGSGLTINAAPSWPRAFPARHDPRLARFLERLNASSASSAWKHALESSLSASDEASVHELFFPCVFSLRPDARVLQAPDRLRREFYAKVAEQSASQFAQGGNVHGIFTHDLTLPIYVRVLAQAGMPGYAAQQWRALPDSLKGEIDLDLLIDFWRLKGVPGVATAFANHLQP